ncbi:hypothetical protein [Streptomyces sp. NPDC053069]|uniref:hypothetical protein n=1 Tax=Streptomyces sp. NPDC053069 TaxID=3365695 RepID=UPI0037D1F5CB
MRAIPSCLAALLTAAASLGLVQVGSASAVPDAARPQQARHAVLAPAAVASFNVEVSKWEDGATVGWMQVAPNQTLRVTLDSSGGYKTTFVAYDGNSNRLGDSGSVNPGAKEQTVWTNQTSNTVTVRVYGDVAPHYVDVRLKGKLIA